VASEIPLGLKFASLLKLNKLVQQFPRFFASPDKLRRFAIFLPVVGSCELRSCEIKFEMIGFLILVCGVLLMRLIVRNCAIIAPILVFRKKKKFANHVSL
jgi:hypothetical protein